MLAVVCHRNAWDMQKSRQTPAFLHEKAIGQPQNAMVELELSQHSNHPTIFSLGLGALKAVSLIKGVFGSEIFDNENVYKRRRTVEEDCLRKREDGETQPCLLAMPAAKAPTLWRPGARNETCAAELVFSLYAAIPT
jgi:hypothetical protein